MKVKPCRPTNRYREGCWIFRPGEFQKSSEVCMDIEVSSAQTEECDS